jgi:cyanosortase A-associated protein
MKPQYRQSLLSGLCIGITLTLGNLLIDPTAGQRQYAAITLPQMLPLTNSQLTNSQFIHSQSIQIKQISQTNQPSQIGYDQILSGQQYHYSWGDSQFDLTLRDLVNTEGDIGKFIHTDLNGEKPPAFEDIQTPLGSYRRFTHHGKIYLVSCLRSDGHSTVTPTQFRNRLYGQLGQIDHLFDWAMGRTSLLEKRCLWVQLTASTQQSLSVNSVNTEQFLDQQWQAVVSWWTSYSSPPIATDHVEP